MCIRDSSIDMVIVDAPSVDISRAGLALISDMDGIVLVIDLSLIHI